MNNETITMKSGVNAQAIFLNHLRAEQETVNAFLNTGIKLTGTIKAFDDYTIVLQNNNRQTLVYKNSISSISTINCVQPIKTPHKGN